MVPTTCSLAQAGPGVWQPLHSCRGLTGILGSENGGLPRGACVPVPSPLSCVFSLCVRSRPDCRCQIRTARLPNWEAGSVFPCCRSILSEGRQCGEMRSQPGSPVRRQVPGTVAMALHPCSEMHNWSDFAMQQRLENSLSLFLL